MTDGPAATYAARLLSRLVTVLTRARAAVERRLLVTTLGLPEKIQRRLAGSPIVLDGQQLATDTQLLLRLKKVARIPPAETLPLEDARAATRHEAAMAAGDQPIGSVRDLTAAGLPARLYVPSTSSESSSESDPLLVFFHGGGFYVGDLDTHDGPCRVLAEQAGVRVLAIDYRLAPEHRFPDAHDDAEAAYHWACDHARELGADPARIGVGGDSAGGNLAAATAIHAARTGLPCVFQLLVYPAVDSARDEDPDNRSLRLFEEGFYLSKAYMDRANEAYVPAGTDLRDPRLSPAYADLPDGLAPTYLCTAGFDPLRDEGEHYARLLEKAGVPVTMRRFEGAIHGFFNVTGAGRSAPAAIAEVVAALRAGLRG